MHAWLAYHNSLYIQLYTLPITAATILSINTVTTLSITVKSFVKLTSSQSQANGVLKGRKLLTNNQDFSLVAHPFKISPFSQSEESTYVIFIGSIENVKHVHECCPQHSCTIAEDNTCARDQQVETENCSK